MGSDKEILSAIRALELEVGRIMRRQSGTMDILRDVRETLQRIERSEKVVKSTVVAHDKWERETKE